MSRGFGKESARETDFSWILERDYVWEVAILRWNYSVVVAGHSSRQASGASWRLWASARYRLENQKASHWDVRWIRSMAFGPIAPLALSRKPSMRSRQCSRGAYSGGGARTSETIVRLTTPWMWQRKDNLSLYHPLCWLS